MIFPSPNTLGACPSVILPAVGEGFCFAVPGALSKCSHGLRVDNPAGAGKTAGGGF